ncbi:MAG: tetratricopeptide repeat protein [Alkalimonas sp.]|nr:tetratricopeptide repeat protein [Alkalimonas sp.]
MRQLFLWAWLALLASPLYASQDVPLGAPLWLQQVIEQQHHQPEAMLQLLLEHQDEVSRLPLHVQRSAYQQFATLYGMMGQHTEQLNYARKGLALDDGVDALRIELLYNLGFATEMQSNYLLAQQHYQTGTELATQLKHEALRLKGQINLAAILSAQEHYQEALALLKEVYQQSGELADQEVTAEINAELGLLYATLGFEEEALQFLDTAYAMYKAMNWRKSKIAVLYNLARTYGFIEQYEQAFSTYQRMLSVSRQYGDHMNLYYAYLGLAITSHEFGRTNTALNYMSKAEEYLDRVQSPMAQVVHLFEKARIYNGLQQNTLAMQQLMLARQLLDEMDGSESDSMQLNILFMQAHLYARQGQFEQAYETFESFFYRFQDRFTQESELALTSLRLSFEQEREQAERALLVKDNELQALRLQEIERKRQIQWLWTGLFASTTLVLMTLLLWQWQRRRRAETLHQTNQEDTKSL